MSLPFTFEACPNRNVCGQTVPDGLICGTSPEHLQPRPLAEQLCYDALQGALEEERAFTPDADIPYGKAEHEYRIGCLLFETALHPRSSALQAQDLFEEGLGYLVGAKTAVGAKPKTVIDSRLVAADLPFFEARKFEGDVDDAMFNSVRREIADIGSFVMGVEAEDEMIAGLIKVGAHLLVLRDGVIFYASTFRELCAAREDLSASQRIYSHTGYLLEGDDKVSVRVNHSKQNARSPYCVSFPISYMVRKAFEAEAPEVFDAFPGRVEATQNFVGWAMDEARGPVSEQQTAVLDAITDNAFIRIEAKYPEAYA